jgi:hypothetical protein
VTDLTTELRRASLTALKANAPLVVLVPAASIFSQTAPANAGKPFIKTGTPIASPMRGSCMNGERIRQSFYVRAGVRKSGANVVETAEDHIGRIVAAVKVVLDLANFPIAGGHAKLRFVNDIRRQIDGEAEEYEANIEFIAKMMAA